MDTEDDMVMATPNLYYGWPDWIVVLSQKYCWVMVLTMQKQSNQAAIDAGFKAINSLFLLNGAAATALLAQSNDGFKAAALCFAMGAFVSIICMAMAHFLALAVTATFQQTSIESIDAPLAPSPFRADKFISYRDLHRLRIKIVLVGVVSATFFLIGVCYTASLL